LTELEIPAIVKLKVALREGSLLFGYDRRRQKQQQDTTRGSSGRAPEGGFRSGQEIEFRASGGVITIAPKLPIAEDEHTPAQRRAIDARLARADEDIRAGRVYGPFDTAEEMAASIETNLKKLRTARRKAGPAR